MYEFKINDILTMDVLIDDTGDGNGEVNRVQAKVRAIVNEDLYLDLDGITLYDKDSFVTCTKEVKYSIKLKRLCGEFLKKGEKSQKYSAEYEAKLIDEKREKWLKTPSPNPPPLSRSYP